MSRRDLSVESDTGMWVREFLKADEFRSRRLQNETPTSVILEKRCTQIEGGNILVSYSDEAKPWLIGIIKELATSQRSCKHPQTPHSLLLFLFMLN